jgi:hypothetical protein
MKRIYILIAALCISAAPLFAYPSFLPEFRLSAGFGNIFNMHWKEGFLRDEFKDYAGVDMRDGVMTPTERTVDAMNQGLFDTSDLTVGGGVFAFFDATFATVGIGLVFNRATQTVAIPDLSTTISPALAGEETHSFLFTQLNLSLLLKYPFRVHERISVFPLVGIDGQIALGDFDDNLRRDFQTIANLGYEVPTLGEFWNSLWLRFGVGADFFLTDKIFLRSEALYGFKFNSAYESRMADYWKEDIRGVANGVHIRLAVGYMIR